MVKEAIEKLTQGKDLSFEETREIFSQIFDRKISAAQIAAFLIALAMKGETAQEIYAAATVVRERARKLSVKGAFVGIELEDEQIMDTCSTGGSGVNKFNISTAVSFVVAAAGIKVAKHGNRAMSSNCGSADVLEALGIKVDVEPGIMQESIKKTGIGFLYAPLYHPALKEVAAIRKEIGTRTVFNLLGPLCNPALASHQVLGVYEKELVGVMAEALKSLEVKKALVVYGEGVKDEVSLCGATTAALVENKRIKKITLKPSDFGLKKIALKDLEVKDAKESANVILDILNGKKSARRDIVLANAGCCFYILGKVANFKEGVEFSASLIDTLKAKEKFIEFKKFIETH